MQFQPTDRFLVSAGTPSQEVNGEAVLLDLNGEGYFGLNAVGTRVWQLIHDGQPFGESLDVLAGEYDVDRAQLDREASGLPDQMSTNDLITLRDA